MSVLCIPLALGIVCMVSDCYMLHTLSFLIGQFCGKQGCVQSGLLDCDCDGLSGTSVAWMMMDGGMRMLHSLHSC